MRRLFFVLGVILGSLFLNVHMVKAEPPNPSDRDFCTRQPDHAKCVMPEPVADSVQPLSATQQAPFQWVRTVLIIPRGTVWDSAGIQAWQIGNLINEWNEVTRSWYWQQTGLTFEFAWPHIHYSTKTLDQLQVRGGVDHGDSCNEGFEMNNIIEELYSIGLDTQYERTFTMVLGGGGWAGGFTSFDNNIAHRGMMFLGDWGARARFGVGQTPCNNGYFNSDAGAWGHETTHTMGIDSHNPCCLFPPRPTSNDGVNWTDAHRQQLWDWNAWVPNFIHWP